MPSGGVDTWNPFIFVARWHWNSCWVNKGRISGVSRTLMELVLGFCGIFNLWYSLSLFVDDSWRTFINLFLLLPPTRPLRLKIFRTSKPTTSGDRPPTYQRSIRLRFVPLLRLVPRGEPQFSWGPGGYKWRTEGSCLPRFERLVVFGLPDMTYLGGRSSVLGSNDIFIRTWTKLRRVETVRPSTVPRVLGFILP